MQWCFLDILNRSLRSRFSRTTSLVKHHNGRRVTATESAPTAVVYHLPSSSLCSHYVMVTHVVSVAPRTRDMVPALAVARSGTSLAPLVRGFTHATRARSFCASRSWLRQRSACWAHALCGQAVRGRGEPRRLSACGRPSREVPSGYPVVILCLPKRDAFVVPGGQSNAMLLALV